MEKLINKIKGFLGQFQLFRVYKNYYLAQKKIMILEQEEGKYTFVLPGDGYTRSFSNLGLCKKFIDDWRERLIKKPEIYYY